MILGYQEVIITYNNVRSEKKTKNSVLRVFPESYQYAVTYSKYSGFFFCYYLGYRHAKPVFIYDSIAWQTQTAGTKD